MGEFKVTGIEKEDEQKSFNGTDEIKEDEKSGLKEVNLQCEKTLTNVRKIFLGNYNTTFTHRIN